jgi:hypothetical protein
METLIGRKAAKISERLQGISMSPSTPRPKNWLLLRLRSWHSWTGMAALLILVMLGLTGIYLNHPELLGLDPVPAETGKLLFTSSGLTALVPIEQALKAAHAEWGEAKVQFVQLREEGNRLVYRVRRRNSSDEVTVDARSGLLVAVRTGQREVRYAEDGTAQENQMSWTRLMFDLHTGRILGFPGRLIADGAGMAILLLSFSGIFLFVIPRWRRWRKRLPQSAEAPPVFSSSSSPTSL